MYVWRLFPLKVQHSTLLVDWDKLIGNFFSKLKIVIVCSDEICEKEHRKTYMSGQRLERKELSLSGQRKDHSYLFCKSGCAAGEC